MKILTIAGTRPELIRLSLIIKKLDKLVDHIFVFTNQNFDPNLSTIFFEELAIRKPDYYFENKGYSIGQFLSNAFIEFEKIIIKEKPDKVLVLGDTNSGLLALIANKYNIPIFHMEAGNRCFDINVPEETNRKLIDHLSTYNLPYTENSKQNLLVEGFHKNYVFKTGNPIYEVLNFYKEKIDRSIVMDKYDLKYKKYVLFTAHRAENVDKKQSLFDILFAINKISEEYRVIFPVHPRTLQKIEGLTTKATGSYLKSSVTTVSPLGFFDFVNLQKNALLTIGDSGTFLEESCIFKVPSITIRNTTERQEVLEVGASILSGTSYENILKAYNTIIQRDFSWEPPADYLVKNVSDIVINILLGK